MTRFHGDERERSLFGSTSADEIQGRITSTTYAGSLTSEGNPEGTPEGRSDGPPDGPGLELGAKEGKSEGAGEAEGVREGAEIESAGMNLFGSSPKRSSFPISSV